MEFYSATVSNEAQKIYPYDKILSWVYCYEIPNFSSRQKMVYVCPMKIDFKEDDHEVINTSMEFDKYFKFIFAPVNYDATKTEYIGLMFEISSDIFTSGLTSFFMNLVFSVVDCEGNLKYSQSLGFKEFKIQKMKSKLKLKENRLQVFGIKNFLRRKTLLDSTEFLPDDKLTLRCGIQYSSYARKFTSDKVIFHHLYIENVLAIFFYKKEVDGNIEYSFKVSNNDKSFPWKKLCKKSLYFKRLYNYLMERNIKTLLPIKKQEYECFLNMIYFLRTENIDHVGEIDDIVELFVLADQYEILELKQLCSDYLKHHLTTDIAADIFSISDLYNDDGLFNHCVQYIISNSVSVFNSDSWQILMEKRTDLVDCVVKLFQMTIIYW